MKQEKNNQWYWHIKGSCLSNSLYLFQVQIKKVKILENMSHFQLTITSKKEKKGLVLHFHTLEEAMQFSDDVVSYTTTMDEITNAYINTVKEKNHMTK